MNPRLLQQLQDWLEGRQAGPPGVNLAQELEAAGEEVEREWEIQSCMDTLLKMENGRIALSIDFRSKLRSHADKKSGRVRIPFFRRLLGFRTIAAAAAIFVAVGLAWWLARSARYPSPQVEGQAQWIEGQPGQRGGALLAGPGGVQVRMGDYCRLKLDEGGVLRLLGAERAEEVFLETGRLTCEVDRRVGRFVVQTHAGSVRVLGTKFIVQVLDGEGTDERAGAIRLAVRVDAGQVLLEGKEREYTLAAGETQVLEAPRPESSILDSVRRAQPREALSARAHRAQAQELLDLAMARQVPASLAQLTRVTGRRLPYPKPIPEIHVEPSVAFRAALRRAADAYLALASAEEKRREKEWAVASAQVQVEELLLALETAKLWLDAKEREPAGTLDRQRMAALLRTVDTLIELEGDAGRIRKQMIETEAEILEGARSALSGWDTSPSRQK
ncbi:MAG: FecR domain-containing protein [Planctomycetes bacterium]|nr:FecR domain-containing protein [Planctomycetota bacterium]